MLLNITKKLYFEIKDIYENGKGSSDSRKCQV